MESLAQPAHESDEDFEMVESQVPASSASTATETLPDGTLPSAETSVTASTSTTAAAHAKNSCLDPTSHGVPGVKLVNKRQIDSLVSVMQANADILSVDRPIFHVKLPSSDKHYLFTAYSSGFDEEHRQFITCWACKKFLHMYGDLCVIEDDGSLRSLYWPKDAVGVPEFYKASVLNLLELFEGQAVGNQFQVSEKMPECRLGRPLSGGWSHMSVSLDRVPYGQRIMSSRDTTTSFEMLDRIMTDYSLKVVQRAHHMLHGDELPYASSHKAPIAYLLDTMLALEDRKMIDPISRNNLVTRYACQAFPGCLSALRSGMIGHLLTLIEDGDDFRAIKESWELKANPHHYLRPTATPSEGNIKSAEKIFAQLGYTLDDLARVYLSYDQVPSTAILWCPPVTELSPEADTSATPKQSLFGHLLPRKAPAKLDDSASNADGPVNKISFRNFALRILPTAKSVDLYLKDKFYGNFFTIGRPGSKPLMAHHTPTNTSSWYVWGSRQPPSSANLSVGWNSVVSILSFPHMWEEFAQARDALDDDATRLEKNFKHIRHDVRFLFALRGAKEKAKTFSLCLFPTLMKSEFHGVRKTVEAFSNAGTIDRPSHLDEKGWVGGLSVMRSVLGKRVGDNGEDDILVRVVNGDGLMSKYNISLWD